MKKLLLASLLLSTSAFANLHLAPPDFDSSYGRAVFVDFKTADYEVTYDLRKMRASVKSMIQFEVTKKGKPLFDLIPNAESVAINGWDAKLETIQSPGGQSTYRLVDQELEPGIYTLTVNNRFKENTFFWPLMGRVSSAFWIRDLKDRMFLEQYFPSNFEYDQYKMTMNVIFKGPKKHRQEIYTNGKVTQTSTNSYKIEFPEYFTVSCPFFHTSPKGRMKRLDFTFPSISGTQIPITVYSPFKSRTKRFKAEAIRVMTELEKDYGPWAHPSLVAYGTFPGTGGMEHSGATATSFKALDHEMLHSYFAKGVMPANGNSGWIDEAIASWRDKGYPRNPTPGFDGSDLGGQSLYKRNTDKRAYSIGADFMGYLDYRLQDVGGLKAFLKGYFETYKHQVITTQHFKNNLEFFSGLNLDQEFNTLIWGKNSGIAEELPENPVHRALTKEELHSLL